MTVIVCISGWSAVPSQWPTISTFAMEMSRKQPSCTTDWLHTHTKVRKTDCVWGNKSKSTWTEQHYSFVPHINFSVVILSIHAVLQTPHSVHEYHTSDFLLCSQNALYQQLMGKKVYSVWWEFHLSGLLFQPKHRV